MSSLLSSCSDGFSTVSDKFAVLHNDTFGNFLEQVSDATSRHVKLFHPNFSTHGVLRRAGFPVKAHCNVLIYQTKKAPPTLHVYLIPCDPALQQVTYNSSCDVSSAKSRVKHV